MWSKAYIPSLLSACRKSSRSICPRCLWWFYPGRPLPVKWPQGIPTTAVAACKDQKLAIAVQKIFNSDTFRIYTNTDVIGVEFGGSVKNVIALACGICDGLKLGTNAKAAVLTRGLVEITRLGMALGARRETFYGLTGLGDLVTTCFSPNSRNRTVGEALGRGRKNKGYIRWHECGGRRCSDGQGRLSSGPKEKNQTCPLSQKCIRSSLKTSPCKVP